VTPIKIFVEQEITDTNINIFVHKIHTQLLPIQLVPHSLRTGQINRQNQRYPIFLEVTSPNNGQK